MSTYIWPRANCPSLLVLFPPTNGRGLATVPPATVIGAPAFISMVASVTWLLGLVALSATKLVMSSYDPVAPERPHACLEAS